jgi:hypothetical protein
MIYFLDNLQKIWLNSVCLFLGGGVSRFFNNVGSRRFVPMAMMAIA